ncbi:hypothetical protein [Parafrankia sp. FMc2]|uniref:hypothetical protein n=1 Tax=Parafrankia sp. FMc2 TaxID=3233196 RepID=UPI0034D5735B
MSAALDDCWIYKGHALYLRRRNEGFWQVHYLPRPMESGEVDRQILEVDEDPDEARRLAEAVGDAGDIKTRPDVEQTRLKAESLDREAGIAGFIAREDLPALDVVPFRYDPTRPPLPPDGLQVGRDDAGTWRTYQERYPGSTLTAGHATNVEAYWACHALRDLAPWAIVIDVRAKDEDEPSRCRLEREILAGRVDGVGERFAHRRTVLPEPSNAREVKGAPGLVLATAGRGDWAVVRTVDHRALVRGIRSQAKATAAARALAALGDLVTVPGYVLSHLPALREDAKAIEWESSGLSAEAPRWAKESRGRAAEIREAVTEKAARDAARRR